MGKDNYEKFIVTTDIKANANDLQFYLDGMNEEHGEISGVIKRMRRGDYDELAPMHGGMIPSQFLIHFGLQKTLVLFDEILSDLVREIGDQHWYQTRFIQHLGLSWNDIEKANMKKLQKRKKQGRIIGSGSNRENKDTLSPSKIKKINSLHHGSETQE